MSHSAMGRWLCNTSTVSLQMFVLAVNVNHTCVIDLYSNSPMNPAGCHFPSTWRLRRRTLAIWPTLSLQTRSRSVRPGSAASWRVAASIPAATRSASTAARWDDQFGSFHPISLNPRPARDLNAQRSAPSPYCGGWDGWLDAENGARQVAMRLIYSTVHTMSN